jgi:hypothetical protein
VSYTVQYIAWSSGAGIDTIALCSFTCLYGLADGVHYIDARVA